jgi:hypothetical protein
MSNPKELLDEFHYHEMLDRLSLVSSIIDTHLLQHPVCKLEKEVSEKVDEALTLLMLAYQTTGNISLKFDKES